MSIDERHPALVECLDQHIPGGEVPTLLANIEARLEKGLVFSTAGRVGTRPYRLSVSEGGWGFSTIAGCRGPRAMAKLDE